MLRVECGLCGAEFVDPSKGVQHLSKKHQTPPLAGKAGPE